MPFPIAHGLIGAGIAAALTPSFRTNSWRIMLTGALLAISPDFDYALNWLRISGGGWHHGFTHSFLFALTLGLMMAIVFGKRKARSVIIYSTAIASHTILDFMMTESLGVALWWPFTDQRYRLRLPNPIDYTWKDGSLSEIVIDVIRICLVELLIFGPILILILLMKRFLVERRVSA